MENEKEFLFNVLYTLFKFYIIRTVLQGNLWQLQDECFYNDQKI